MPVKFLKFKPEHEVVISETTFICSRLSSAQIETIRRGCYEEGKMGVRLALSDSMFHDQLIMAAVHGWKNFVDANTDEVIEYSDAVKKEFVDYADEGIKSLLAAAILNPTNWNAIFVAKEKKDSEPTPASGLGIGESGATPAPLSDTQK